jgi:hypothetical protein
MYGMINRALEDMVLSYHGQETWRTVLRKANVDVEMFVRMETYPDSMTYSLVGAASEVLGKTVPDLLRDFGIFWVRYTGSEGYGPLLDEAGENLTEVLSNLDEMHFRLGTIFPMYGAVKPGQGMQPPQFSCTDIDGKTLTLHYYSKRAGLAPMVMGLVEGLAERLKCAVEIQQLTFKDRGDDHDSFSVRYT